MSQAGNKLMVLRIGVKKFSVFKGIHFVYGVSPHAREVLERLCKIIFGYGFQEVDYLVILCT